MLADNDPTKRLADEVTELLAAEKRIDAAKRVRDFLQINTSVDTDAQANTILCIFLHWLLNNGGMEEAAMMLWGKSQFDPRPESTQRVWKAFETHNNILLMGAGSMSKCLEPNTLCRMFDGSVKRAGDIREGDKLAGDDGTPRTVLERHDGEAEMFRVQPFGAPAFECNGDHILSLVCTQTRRNHGGRYGVSSGYTPGKIVDIPLREYLTWGKQRKEAYPLFTRCAPMSEKPVDVDPYIYGSWLGDGTGVRMELTTPAGPMQAEWSRYWTERGYPVVDRRGLPTCGTWFVESEFVTGRGFGGGRPRRFCEWARGRVVNGEKRIGADYLRNSEENRLKLLAGLVDSDGTASCGAFDIVTKWIGLADDIAELARGLGFMVVQSTREHGIKSTGFEGEYHHVRIMGDCERIPTLEKQSGRKTPRRLTHGFSTSGFTVEPMGPGVYAGFGVDGNHRFLLASGIVTHNSFSMAIKLFLEWIRDPEYTTVKVLGPSETHLEDNLFTHLVSLHKSSRIPLPGQIGKLFIGLDLRQRKSSISGVVVPIGKKAAGRLQGVKRFPRKKAHPIFGKLSRLFIFLDEIANIPVGIWRDIDNLLSNTNGDGLKIAGAFNPTNQNDSVGQRCEPPFGWGSFEADKHFEWVSSRGWFVVRLDALYSENVKSGKVIYEGLQTKAGFDLIVQNSGGMDSPGYWAMARGCFPPTGTVMSVIPPGYLDRWKADIIWFDTPRGCAGVDLALEGDDAARFVKGLFGPASAVKLAPTLAHPEGQTIFFLDSKGRKRPRSVVLVEQIFKMPKGDTIAQHLEIIRLCRTMNISAEWVAVDRTGNGQGVFDMLKYNWGPVIGVNFYEGASDTRIMAEDMGTAKELFDRAQSELWFGLRKFMEFQYCFAAPGLDTTELAPQLTNRLFRTTGSKSKVESKPEYKSRNQNKSPDDADGLTLLILAVRRASGMVPGMSADNSTEPDLGDEDEGHGDGYCDLTNRFDEL